MRLTKLYTRTGDKGTTRLANGTEVPKDALRVSAYGDVDELNSVIGVVLTEDVSAEVGESLTRIQHELFNLGGELASAGMADGLINEDMVSKLEGEIDTFNATVPMLEEFILPGGTRAAALIHLARTICRRTERSIVTLGGSKKIPEVLIHYVNRLSDLLFVMARVENHRQGNTEIYWKNPRRTS